MVTLPSLDCVTNMNKSSNFQQNTFLLFFMFISIYMEICKIYITQINALILLILLVKL